MKTPAKLQRQAAEKISHRPRAMCELDEAIDLGIGIDAAKRAAD
jgi:inosine/xanthosine triphosphate pyrophosphatase family protein